MPLRLNPALKPSAIQRPFLSSTLHHRKMATEAPPAAAPAPAPGIGAITGSSFASFNVKTTDIKTEPGIQLSDHQKLLVGSVLDLFGGNPTLKHFSLWAPNATFSDNITVAQGEAKYKAQFYGLPALFNPIRIQAHSVTSSGNPIELRLKNEYTVKGIKKAQTVDSVVDIHVGDDGKITKLEDKWNGHLPEGAVSETFRKLNAVVVPMMVKVPKTEEEDLKMRNEREKNAQQPPSTGAGTGSST